MASALPGAAEGAAAGTSGRSASAAGVGGAGRWRLAEEPEGAAGLPGGDPLEWFGAGAAGGGSPHLARAQARFREAAALAVELAGLRRGLQCLPPAPPGE